MKTAIHIIMLSVFCMSCRGQNVQHKENNKSSKEAVSTDTMSILSLQNKQYGSFNYSILLLRLSDLDKLGYRIKSIAVTQNNKTITSIPLPNSEDIKNFSVNKIAETEDGFKIVVNWGGGNYFYGREFYFTFKGNQFYLDSLQMNSYIQEPEKETRTTKKIDPPILIDKFEIFNYLKNK